MRVIAGLLGANLVRAVAARLLVEGDLQVDVAFDLDTVLVTWGRFRVGQMGGSVDNNPFSIIQLADTIPTTGSSYSLVFQPPVFAETGTSECVGFVFDIPADISGLQCKPDSVADYAVPAECVKDHSVFAGVSVRRFFVASDEITLCQFNASAVTVPEIAGISGVSVTEDLLTVETDQSGVACTLVRSDLFFRVPTQAEIAAHGNTDGVFKISDHARDVDYEVFCAWSEIVGISRYQFRMPSSSAESSSSSLSFTGALGFSEGGTEIAVSMELEGRSGAWVRCLGWWAADSTTNFQAPEVTDPITLQPKPENYTLTEAASREGAAFWTRTTNYAQAVSAQSVFIGFNGRAKRTLTMVIGNMRVNSKYWIACQVGTAPVTTIATLYTGTTTSSLPIGNFLATRATGGAIIAGIVEITVAKDKAVVQCEVLATSFSSVTFEGPRPGVLTFKDKGQVAIWGKETQMFMGRQLVGVKEDQQVSWCQISDNLPADTLQIMQIMTGYAQVTFMVTNVSSEDLATVGCEILPWTASATGAPLKAQPLENYTFPISESFPISAGEQKLLLFGQLHAGNVYEIVCSVKDGSLTIYTQQTTHTDGPRVPVEGFWTCDTECTLNMSGFQLSSAAQIHLKRTPEACACVCMSACSTVPIFGLDVTYSITDKWCFVDITASTCSDIQFHAVSGQFVSQEACVTEAVSRVTSDNGNSIQLGSVSDLVGGMYSLCYDSQGTNDFRLYIGDLFVRSVWYCDSLNSDCALEVHRYSLPSSVDNRIVLRNTDCKCACVSDCSTAIVNGLLRLPNPWCYISARTSCPDALLEFTTRKYISQTACVAVIGIGAEDRGLSLANSEESDSSLEWKVNFGGNDVLGASFVMCHCAYPCRLLSQMVRKVGTLVIRGPTTAQVAATVSCVAGKRCAVHLANIAAGKEGDRVTLCDVNDREPVASIPSTDGMNFQWNSAFDQQSSAGIRLCWCGAHKCADYAVHAGALSLVGPVWTRAGSTCYVGRECQITVEGVALSVSSDRAVLRLFTNNAVDTCTQVDVSEPAVFGYPIGIGGKEVFKFPTMTDGGTRGIVCWCRQPCESLADYTVSVTLFKVIGPGRITGSCLKGKLCSIDFAGALTDFNLRFTVFSGECASGQLALGESADAAVVRLPATPLELTSYTVAWKTALQNDGGIYNICWRESQSQSTAYSVQVGTLTIRAPVSAKVYSCQAFGDCEITIEGADLDATQDRVVLSPSCGSQMSLSTQAIFVSGTDTEIVYKFPGLTARVGNLCWCGGPGCALSTNGADYQVSIGVLVIAGVFQVQTSVCYEGTVCQVQLKGVALLSNASLNRRTGIASGSFCQSQSDSTQWFSKTSDVTVINDNTLQGDFGKVILYPDDLKAPQAPLVTPMCWCILEESNLVSCLPAGSLQVRTYEEYYRTFVNPAWTKNSKRTLIVISAVSIPVVFAVFLIWKFCREKVAEIVKKSKGSSKSANLTEDEIAKPVETMVVRSIKPLSTNDSRGQEENEEVKLYKQLIKQRSQIASSLFYKKVETELEDPRIEVRITTTRRIIHEDEISDALDLNSRHRPTELDASEGVIVSDMSQTVERVGIEVGGLSSQSIWSRRKQSLVASQTRSRLCDSNPFAIEDSK